MIPSFIAKSIESENIEKCLLDTTAKSLYRFPLRNEMRRTEEANAYLTFRSKTIHRQEVSSYIFITLRRVSYPYLT